MKYQAIDARRDFESQFGELNIEKLWTLVRFAKHVRMRCRSNKAFNNYVNACFPYARFDTVDKERRDGTSYQGLSIRIGENTMEESNDDE